MDGQQRWLIEAVKHPNAEHGDYQLLSGWF
jgi:hypothetical protein